MKVEREFLTIDLKRMPGDCMRSVRQKSTLVHGFTQRDYTLGKNNHFNYTSGEKKIGVHKTTNSESIFKTGHLSNMSESLTFHVIRISTQGSF